MNYQTNCLVFAMKTSVLWYQDCFKVERSLPALTTLIERDLHFRTTKLIWNEIYDPANSPSASIVIYSNQLPAQNMRTWQPRFLLVVYNYLCQIAKTTKK